MNNKETGKLGENAAKDYLIAAFYKIIKTNHKERSDEIDIISRHKNGTLVFVEVKALSLPLSGITHFMPEDNLTLFKLHKISRACRLFAAKHPQLIDEERGWQIDLIAITFQNGSVKTLTHYPNI